MRDVTLSRRDMLRALGTLTAGAAIAESPKSAAAERSGAGRGPTFWMDSAMPEVTHRMVETNGIRLHVAEQGEGPLIIFCHGFPECWYSWRHQLPALAKAGFRAVAPDLRGYGQSDRPEEMDKYTILDDIGDIVGLVDALGAQQAVIAGHDIGAAIAWQTALLRPDRFRAVIALSPPFRSRGFGDSGATVDAHAADRECGVLPALPPDSRGGGGARARLAPHVPSSALLALGRQVAGCRRRRVCWRDGSPERCSLNRSGVLAGLDHGVRHRCLCRGIHPQRVPRPLELVAQYRSRLGVDGSLRRSGGDRSRAVHGGRARFCRRRFLPVHREAVSTGPQAPAPDNAAGLWSLDPAGTCARGEHRHDRLPSELVGEDENADIGERQGGCHLGYRRFLRSLRRRYARDPWALGRFAARASHCQSIWRTGIIATALLSLWCVTVAAA